MENLITRHQNVISKIQFALNARKGKVCRSSSSTPQNTSGHFSQTMSPPAQTNTITPSTQLPEEYQLFSIQQAGTDSHTKLQQVPLAIAIC